MNLVSNCGNSIFKVASLNTSRINCYSSEVRGEEEATDFQAELYFFWLKL